MRGQAPGYETTSDHAWFIYALHGVVFGGFVI